MRRAPDESVVIMIAGSISGAMPTASARAKKTDSTAGRPSRMLKTRMPTASSNVSRMSKYPKWLMPCSKAV